MFEKEPNIIGVFVLENNEITYSYPDVAYVGKDFDSAFTTFSAQLNNQKLFSVEFTIDQNRKLVLVVPFDFFTPVRYLINQDYKFVLATPLSDIDNIIFQETPLGNTMHQLNLCK